MLHHILQEIKKQTEPVGRYSWQKKLYQFWLPFLGRFFVIFVLCALFALSEKWSVYDGFVVALVVSLLLQAWNLFRITEWIECNQDPTQDFGKTPMSLTLFKPLIKIIKRARRNEDKFRNELSSVLETFQNAMQILPFGVVVLDQNLSIKWANHTAEKHFRVDVQKDIGLNLVNLTRGREMTEFLRDAQSESLLWQPLHLKNTHLLLSRIPFGGQDVLLLSEDVSEKYQADLIRKQFVANASHELQTPLTILRGYAELLLQTRPQEDQSSLHLMVEQVDRISALVRDMLWLSQLEHDSPAKKEPVDIELLSQKVFDEMVAMPAVMSKQLRMSFDWQLKKGFRLNCYAKEWVSVVQNLLSNAIRFTPENGAVSMLIYRDEDCVVLAVVDTGCGIDAPYIEHLGTRFYRPPMSSLGDGAVVSGTGLGLAIVKQIAARHQGFLRIHSVLHQGSRFEFRVPIDEQSVM
jgi:two-component system phosphate regulon sensor histidine kinase PhoR